MPLNGSRWKEKVKKGFNLTDTGQNSVRGQVNLWYLQHNALCALGGGMELNLILLLTQIIRAVLLIPRCVLGILYFNKLASSSYY